MKTLFFLFIIFTSSFAGAKSSNLEITVNDIFGKPCPDIKVELKSMAQLFASGKTNDKGVISLSFQKIKSFTIQLYQNDVPINSEFFSKGKGKEFKRKFTIKTEVKEHINNSVSKIIRDEMGKYGYDSMAGLPDSVDCSIMDYNRDADFYLGATLLMKYVNTHVEYPVKSLENGDQGKVYVEFLINRDGSLTDIKISRGVSKELDHEAKRLIREMPKWIPAFCDGIPVKTKARMPIAFRLD